MLDNRVTLIHEGIRLCCLSFTLYASAILLFKRTKTFIPTPIIVLYFCFTGSASIICLIKCFYSIIWWRQDEILFNPITLYYISGIPDIYVNFAPMADFFLCFDRCLLVAFPMIYTRRLQGVIGGIFVFFNITAFTVYFLATKFFAFNPKESTTTCTYYFCLVLQLNYPRIILYLTYIFCGLNLAVAIILICLLNFRKNHLPGNPKIANKFNRPVLLITFITIFCEFSPEIFAQVFQSIVGSHPSEYLGEYNSTFTYINIVICVGLYWRTFRKHVLKKNNNNNGSVIDPTIKPTMSNAQIHIS